MHLRTLGVHSVTSFTIPHHPLHSVNLRLAGAANTGLFQRQRKRGHNGVVNLDRHTESLCYRPVNEEDNLVGAVVEQSLPVSSVWPSSDGATLIGFVALGERLIWPKRTTLII